VTSSTLRELGLRVDIEAKEFTIPGLISAILLAQSSDRK
jgi:uroporphyrinogen-III synthase